MTLTPERLNELIADCKIPGDVGKLYSRMLQQMINRSLNAEMDAHLEAGRRSHGQSATDTASLSGLAQVRPRRNGMTTRDIEDAVHELYGVTISHTLIAGLDLPGKSGGTSDSMNATGGFYDEQAETGIYGWV